MLCLYSEMGSPEGQNLMQTCTIPEIDLIFQHMPLPLMAEWKPQNLPERIKTFSSGDHQSESNSNYKLYLFCGLWMACITRNHSILLKVVASREKP